MPKFINFRCGSATPRPPTTSALTRVECDVLETNFMKCLNEKGLKDNVPVRECNNEYVA